MTSNSSVEDFANLEPQFSELGNFTKSIATMLRSCANICSADELLQACPSFDEWFCTSVIKQKPKLAEALRKFRQAFNIGEKAKVEFEEFRAG